MAGHDRENNYGYQPSRITLRIAGRLYQSDKAEIVVPLHRHQSSSNEVPCMQKALTHNPALDNFRDKKRSATETIVITMIDTKEPIILPRWSAWMSRLGLTLGGSTGDMALGREDEAVVLADNNARLKNHTDRHLIQQSGFRTQDAQEERKARR